jgi:hypothetical protein
MIGADPGLHIDIGEQLSRPPVRSAHARSSKASPTE